MTGTSVRARWSWLLDLSCGHRIEGRSAREHETPHEVGEQVRCPRCRRDVRVTVTRGWSR